MKHKILIALGVLLILAGGAGFLASSVALATADQATELNAPDGIELRLSREDPLVQKRKRQGESVLFGSLLSGMIGSLLVGTGWWLSRKR